MLEHILRKKLALLQSLPTTPVLKVVIARMETYLATL